MQVIDYKLFISRLLSNLNNQVKSLPKFECAKIF